MPFQNKLRSVMNVTKDYVTKEEIGLALPRGTHTSVAEVHTVPSVSIRARTTGLKPGDLLLLRGAKITQTLHNMGTFAAETNISLMN